MDLGRGGRELVWGWYGFGMELVRILGSGCWYEFDKDLVGFR